MGQLLQAAAALRPVSRPKYVAYILLAMFVQINWGLYGVCSRFLQTQAAKPIPTLQLSVVLSVVAWAGLIVFYTLPSTAIVLAKAARQQWQRHHAKQQAAHGSVQVVVQQPKVEPLREPNGGKASSGAEAALGRQHCTWQTLRSLAVAAGIGGLVAAQGLTLVYASKFTLAYLVQLVFMLTPLAAAMANKALLKQPTPYKLWPTVFVTLAGSVLIVVGNYLDTQHQHAEHGSPHNVHDMAIGLSLAVVSMLLLTAYLLSLQVTQHIVTGVQVMWSNAWVGIIVFTPLACAVEGTDWSWVTALRPLDWAVLVFAGFFIDACNTIFTQHCSRVLGAAVVSMFICLRLVSSLVGSIVLMQEVPHDAVGAPLVWSGFGVVIVAMTTYMVLQRLKGGQAGGQAGLPREASLAAAAFYDDAGPNHLQHALSSLQPGAASAIELQRRLLKTLQRQPSTTVV